MKKKQIIGAAAASAMAAVMIIQGAYAYLTDTATEKNTFTVGKVDIELAEDKYKGAGEAAHKNLVCNQTVDKDPVVRLADGSADAIVFLEVKIPTSDKVVFLNSDGTRDSGEKSSNELFTFTSSSKPGEGVALAESGSSNTINSGWTLISHTGSSYVFGYTKKLSGQNGDNKTTPLFDKVTLRNFVDITNEANNNKNMVSGSAQEIIVTAKAIQSSYIGSLEDTKGTSNNAYTLKDLEDIYGILGNQTKVEEEQSSKT